MLGGVFMLQAGTFALAYGTLQGGTLALDGGVLQASGGTLEAVTVQGTLAMTQANATLFAEGGLTMQGAGGTGTGTIAITGSYATLDFIGTQILGQRGGLARRLRPRAGTGRPGQLQRVPTRMAPAPAPR